MTIRALYTPAMPNRHVFNELELGGRIDGAWMSWTSLNSQTDSGTEYWTLGGEARTGLLGCEM